VRPFDRLHELTDDVRPGGVGELGELLEMLICRPPRARSLSWRADQDGPFDRGFDGDELFADGILQLSP
jgi:hypothetical protein